MRAVAWQYAPLHLIAHSLAARVKPGGFFDCADPPLKMPVDEIFAAVEAYERFVGALAARAATEPHIERTV